MARPCQERRAWIYNDRLARVVRDSKIILESNALRTINVKTFRLAKTTNLSFFVYHGNIRTLTTEHFYDYAMRVI